MEPSDFATSDGSAPMQCNERVRAALLFYNKYSTIVTR